MFQIAVLITSTFAIAADGLKIQGGISLWNTAGKVARGAAALTSTRRSGTRSVRGTALRGRSLVAELERLKNESIHALQGSIRYFYDSESIDHILESQIFIVKGKRCRGINGLIGRLHEIMHSARYQGRLSKTSRALDDPVHEKEFNLLFNLVSLLENEKTSLEKRFQSTLDRRRANIRACETVGEIYTFLKGELNVIENRKVNNTRDGYGNPSDIFTKNIRELVAELAIISNELDKDQRNRYIQSIIKTLVEGYLASPSGDLTWFTEEVRSTVRGGRLVSQFQEDDITLINLNRPKETYNI